MSAQPALAPSNSIKPTIFALASATLIIAHQVAGKATRDALFLSQFSVTELPKIVIVSALLSILGVVGMSRLLTRFGPAKLIPAVFILSALLFIFNWWVYQANPVLIALTLYIQMAIFGGLLISGFWSVVNERFDPHSAKQTIARVAAAATLGGVLGGLTTEQVVERLDIDAMLLVLAGLHLACAYCVAMIGAPATRRTITNIEMRSGFQIISHSRYLILMASLMVMVSVIAALADFAFKAEAVIYFSNENSLAAFFARFYAVAGVLTFLIQSALGGRMLARFGLGSTLAIMPLLLLFTGFLHIFVAKLWSAIVVRGVQMILANSFFRAAFEILYTPMSPSHKRPTKTIIDVASDRVGDVIGGGTLLALFALAPGLSTSGVIFVAIIVALIALLVVYRLYNGYVEQLAVSLRDGSLEFDQDTVIDATTRRAIAVESTAGERALLQADIPDLKHQPVGQVKSLNRGTSAPGFSTQPSFVTEQRMPEQLSEKFASSVEALTSGDGKRIRRFLNDDFIDIRLAPFLVTLLAVDELAEDVRLELRSLVPRCTGLLADSLLEPDIPLKARQRIPSVLEVSQSPRAVLALQMALQDEEFNVRYGCARALARMKEQDSNIAFDSETIYLAVITELKHDEDFLPTNDLVADIDLPIDRTPTQGLTIKSATYGMEHVFTLLGLVHDKPALELSLQAIYSDDENLRGTALEYLENIIPDSVRDLLWPHFGLEPSPRIGHAQGVVIGDLLSDMRKVLIPDSENQS